MRRRIVVGGVAALILAGLLGAACGGVESGAGPGPAPDAVRVGGPDVAAARGVSKPGVDQAAGEAAFRDAEVAGVPEAAAAAVPRLGARVVKTGAISLRVPRRSFDERFHEATTIASRHGGFVESSSTSGSARPSGSLVLRVPADSFEAALGDLRRLGRVTGQRVSGEDVTARYVDLEARLRNWRAQETVLLRLMARANSIEDSIVVQRQLQEVQLAIEEIRGQLRVLDDQTEFSTISVSMAEAGFVPPSRDPGPSLARAWRQAVEAFVWVLAAVVVGLGYLVPAGLIALGLVLAWRAYRRRGRPAPAPAS